MTKYTGLRPITSVQAPKKLGLTPCRIMYNVTDKLICKIEVPRSCAIWGMTGKKIFEVRGLHKVVKWSGHPHSKELTSNHLIIPAHDTRNVMNHF